MPLDELDRPAADRTVEERRQRPIRTFVLRAGRIGSGQRRALDGQAHRYLIAYAPERLDVAASFGRTAPLVVEIGFGMGQATAQIAAAHPEVDFLGIEVHPPGVGALVQRIESARLSNLRIVRHDAVEVLEHMLAPDTLAGVNIFFPDPWPKKRHWKRRLIQPPFVRLVGSRLASGGRLHCATDWQPYAEQMLEVLSNEPGLVNIANGYIERPDERPTTRFEERGRRLGHQVFDLKFLKR